MRRPADATLAAVWILSLLSHLLFLSSPSPGQEGAGEDQDHLRASDQDMAWWCAARFGVFICWGPCSLAEGEIGWSRHGPRPGHRSEYASSGVPLETYDSLYEDFRAGGFRADEWVEIIRDAGAQYVIFLTKHHDGFCMFDSALTDYKVTNTPYGRDVTAELAEACRRQGIRIFWYYSQPDWHHPKYRTAQHTEYIEYLHGQIRELCTNYGRIDGIWFDGLGGSAADWDSEALFKLIRSLQPGVLINNRAGLPGDFDTPEQTIGRFQLDRPWESCITMGVGWSWRGADKPVKSLKECMHLLIRCAGGGGNLALDTGPMPDGRIDPRHERRYREMGAWLRTYGESVYGTQGGPYRPAPWGVTTRKASTVYLHVLSWDADELALPPLDRAVRSWRVLTGGEASVTQDADSLTVSLPAACRDDIDTIVALEVEGQAADIPTVSMIARGSLTLGKTATASGEWSPDYGAAMAFDGDENTRWGGVPESKDGWLAVDLGQTSTFGRILILEESWNRIRRFELQARDDPGEEWQTFHDGTTVGDLRLRFEPVSARYVRLNVLEASDVPTIWEVHLYAPVGE